ncbi:MAG: HAMP domain-containing histidine kinase [Ardenticatenaceae bacterium]|nr:HAMP domain-containing histidine kinase [Ardenticatenaceae bacterium]HBY97850.1 hypothetical protein [Chloroflexota bacterium]
MRSLRNRLILSHILPLSVIIPLMGIALVYVLETQVLLPSLSNELTEQAHLIADLARDHPDIWSDPAQAQAFVARVSSDLTARVMLLDPNGRILAASEASDAGQAGQLLTHPGVATVQAGQMSIHQEYSQQRQAEVADVLVAVRGSDQQIVGIVRLTHRLETVLERFLRLRHLIAGVLVAGLLLGAAVGWVLALDLERPIREVTRAIYGLSSGERLIVLPEHGPDEIRMLAHGVNTLVERLRTLEQTRHQLLANLVHELGRPLGALRSAVHALGGRAGEDPAVRQELLHGMDEALTGLQRLLDDLAHLHDQLVRTVEVQCQPITLQDWLTDVQVPWEKAAQEKGLHWQATIPPALPTIEGDPDRLAQVMGNLLSNAIKYTPPGGTVSVDAGQENGQIWIAVSDTGPGIAPEEQARIFTPFYRGGANRRFAHGMGLGLSIARNLAIAHGGRLEVQSTSGVGSRFTLWLPIRAGLIAQPTDT